MSQKTKRIAELIFKHIEGDLSPAEKTELESWVDVSEQNSLKFHELTNSRRLAEKVKQLREFETDKKAAWTKLLEKGLPEREPIPLFAWKRFVAIAAAVLIFVGGAYLLTRPKNDAVTKTNTRSQPAAGNIAPGHDGAILTLANGKTIVLDSVANGELATQGNARLVKTAKGQLAYRAESSPDLTELLTNELSTPRGRKFQLTLPDGTMVWLNAASSIRYTASFTGKPRRVDITGEVYFEVKPQVAPGGNGKLPFVVYAGGTAVQVVGTHFNVMAYADEKTVTTTLLEGSVRVVKDKATALLKPGQQATSLRSAQAAPGIKLVADADIELAMAWKTGFTSFRHADIQSLMRQVERWYDIDVAYEGALPARTFSGDVPRTADLTRLLLILDANDIHYRVEGRKLTLTP